MIPFDPVRAQREILAGLADVHEVIHARRRDAERRLGEAEIDFNGLSKIERFVAELMEQARLKLNYLEEQARTQQQAGSPP